MDTKSKKFSYSLPIKVIAFAIMLICVCIGVFQFSKAVIMSANGEFEPTLSSSYIDSYFNYTMQQDQAQFLEQNAFLKSEENIIAGNTATQARLFHKFETLYDENWEQFVYGRANEHGTSNELPAVESSEYKLTPDMVIITPTLGSPSVAASLNTAGMTSLQIDFNAKYATEINNFCKEIIKQDLISFRYNVENLTDWQNINYYMEIGEQIIANIPKPTKAQLDLAPAYISTENFITTAKTNVAAAKQNFTPSSRVTETIGQTYELSANDCAYLIYTDEYFAPLIEQHQVDFGMTKKIVAFEVTLIALALACFVFLTCVAGKRERNGEVALNWTDRIFTEIEIIAAFFIATGYVFLMWWLLNENMMKGVPIATAAAFVALFALYISLVRKIKSHTFVETTLIFRVVRFVWRLIAKPFRKLKDAINGGPACRRTVLIVVLYGVACALTVFVFPVAIALIIGAAIIAGRSAKTYEALEYGVSEMKNGNLDYKIDVTQKSIFEPIAANINSISDGLKLSVEKALTSERMKSELVTNVSHDIRTPLTSIITYVDLLKNEGLQSENAGHYLEIIDQKAQRLKTLTDDLFEVSKATSGNITVNFEIVDFSAIITQGMGELNDKIEQSGLDFKVNMPENPVMVRADGKHLWRVVENLLFNVFKYAMKNSRVYIDITQQAAFAHFTMKNISENELNIEAGELTDRFKRGDESRQSEGSGLGLAIAKSLVELQKGTFEVTVDGDLFKAEVMLPLADTNNVL